LPVQKLLLVRVDSLKVRFIVSKGTGQEQMFLLPGSFFRWEESRRFRL
jgi:hypothetical protein